MNIKKITLFLPIIMGLMGSVLAHIGEDEYAHHSMMENMMYGNYWYGGTALGWLINVLIIIALILFIVWMVKQIQKK